MPNVHDKYASSPIILIELIRFSPKICFLVISEILKISPLSVKMSRFVLAYAINSSPRESAYFILAT
ncbi:MAG: Uncharacterised protein [Bacteroidetes bacterium MED-G17]|nr:MAG: Uncharacterised protein [Bacteroidetes bacterium MED-G17]